jgi:hypothetical protein
VVGEQFALTRGAVRLVHVLLAHLPDREAHRRRRRPFGILLSVVEEGSGLGAAARAAGGGARDGSVRCGVQPMTTPTRPTTAIRVVPRNSFVGSWVESTPSRARSASKGRPLSLACAAGSFESVELADEARGRFGDEITS